MGDLTQTNNGVLEQTGLSDAFVAMMGEVPAIGKNLETIPAPDLMVFPIDVPLPERTFAPRVPDFTGSRKYALAKDADEVRYVFEEKHDALVDVISHLPPSCQEALKDSTVVITGNTKSGDLTVTIEGRFKLSTQERRLMNLAKAMIEKAINDKDYTCPEMYDRETGQMQFNIELVRVVFGAHGPQAEVLFG